MWEPDPKRVKEEELWFRINQDYITTATWNNPSSLMYFTKDFIREFKDKFNWETTESKVILRIQGRKFYKEMTGENYKL